MDAKVYLSLIFLLTVRRGSLNTALNDRIDVSFYEPGKDLGEG